MSQPVERVEIITGRERRGRYTAAEKVRPAEETAGPGMTVSAVARLHGVSPSLLFGWRRPMAEGGLEARGSGCRGQAGVFIHGRRWCLDLRPSAPALRARPPKG